MTIDLWIIYILLFVFVVVLMVFIIKRKPRPIQKRHIVRQAEFKDLESIMDIVKDAKDLHEQNGTNQWPKDKPYPSYMDFLQDLNAKTLFVYDYGEEVIGVAAIINADDPNYGIIYDGEWVVPNGNYLTIHRMATKKEYYHKGVARTLISFAISYAKQNSLDSIRVDTHKDNKEMNDLLQKSGFTKCGTIYLDNDSTRSRIVYELKV